MNRFGRMRLEWLLLGFLWNAFVSENSPAQYPASSEETLRVNVNLVTVGVRVEDRSKQVVRGLVADDFLLFEDNKPQKIAAFASEHQPVSVVFVLDRSYSMGEGRKLDEAKSALKHLLQRGHSQNEYALVVFDDEPLTLLDFPSDPERVASLLERIVSERGGSSVYDSVVAALERLAHAHHPRQALVVLTDGTDQHSRLKLSELTRIVQSSRAQLYWIGYFDPEEDRVFRTSGKTVTLVSGREIDNPRFVFRQLARESGAEGYFPASGSDLNRIAETIVRDLESQYTLAYYSTSPFQEDDYRRIQVKVRRQGLQVRARSGFRRSGYWRATHPPDSLPAVAQSVSSNTVQQRALPFASKLNRVAGRLTFREDFADPSSGWPVKPGFSYEAGQYRIAQFGRAGDEGLLAANGPWWTDFEASVSLELDSGTPASYPIPRLSLPAPSSPVAIAPASGLVFRLNERGYYALLVTRPFGAAKLSYKVIRKSLKPMSVADLLNWTSEWRPESGKTAFQELRVVCRRNLIQIHVDGLRLGHVEDHNSSDGMVGVVLFGNGRVTFDNLVVQEIKE